MSVNNIGNNPQIYTVNKDGAILVNSIKDKSIFSFAKQCDKNNNSILETDEINEFLSRYGKVRDNDKYSVYYEQKDRSGNLMKKCFLMKENNLQLRYSYKKGKPYICVLTKSDGKKIVIHLDKKRAHYYDNPNKPAEYKSYVLNDENIKNYTDFGLEKSENKDMFKKLKNLLNILSE